MSSLAFNTLEDTLKTPTLIVLFLMKVNGPTNSFLSIKVSKCGLLAFKLVLSHI